MRSGLSFDHIFPIQNDASARLMRLKADCLLNAGIIDAEDRLIVYARACAALGFSQLRPTPALSALTQRSQGERSQAARAAH